MTRPRSLGLWLFGLTHEDAGAVDRDGVGDVDGVGLHITDQGELRHGLQLALRMPQDKVSHIIQCALDRNLVLTRT
jgi:hypothetical protein